MTADRERQINRERALARVRTTSRWSSLRVGRLNPHYKEKERKFGWLAEQQIIINSDEISKRDS